MRKLSLCRIVVMMLVITVISIAGGSGVPLFGDSNAPRVKNNISGPVDPNAGTITVTAPNGGEILKPGSTYLITWTSSGVTDPIRIRLSTDGGVNYLDTLVAKDLSNTGFYSWTVSNTPSTSCRIKVYATNASGTPFDVSDANFTISDESLATISIAAPAAGLKLQSGTVFPITWKSSKKLDQVDVSYTTNAGADFIVIANGIDDNGTINWTVPTVNTSTALIRLNGLDSSGNSYTVVSGYFTITTDKSEPYVYFVAPVVGESVGGGTNYKIRWVGSKAYTGVELHYSYDHGTKGAQIIANTPDTGYYLWKVPNNFTATDARLWMKGFSPTGNAVKNSPYFSITQTPGTITVTAPNGGESLAQNSVKLITWTTTGTVGNVAIFYSIDAGYSWNQITASTPTTGSSGSYSWVVRPYIGSNNCLVRVSAVSNPALLDVSNAVFSMGGQKQITLNKTRLNFGYIRSGSASPTQYVFISNPGSGTLDWTLSSSASWIKVDKIAGTGNGYLGVFVDPTGLTNATNTGTITITDPDATNSPRTIAVNLYIKDSNQDTAPIGAFATPVTGTTGVAGSIAVTGWALDDIALDSVKIYRTVSGTDLYIGDAVFVEGARPDVEAAYPDYPANTAAGFGYMMLTNFLPDGQTTLKIIASDKTGRQTTLGTSVITLDNAHATKPFGAIDNPAQGGSVTTRGYTNNGWVLTPMPNSIPTNGSTINVFIDGVAQGKATYNIPRPDIAALFPGYANSAAALAYYNFDSSRFANGVHTIAWNVSDNVGNSDGIGSRYFSILNSDSTMAGSAFGLGLTSLSDISAGQSLVDSTGSIDVRNGYSAGAEPQVIYPDETGVFRLKMKELDRVEIKLDKNRGMYSGFMKVGDELRPLPVGSSIDPQTGIFYWQTGPGFVGEYELVFIAARDGFMEKKQVGVTIEPKSSRVGDTDFNPDDIKE